MRRFFLLLISLLLFGSCTKDRIFPDDPINPNSNDTASIAAEYLFINEFLASGDAFTNEFGAPADWIEIYNPHTFPVTLEQDKWYITDAYSTNKEKYNIPTKTIPARGYLIIWADNQHNNPAAVDVHANFALSGAGEHLGLFFKKNESDLIEIDQRQFGAQIANVSEGRSPDGSANWITFNNPSPGASNP